jgi:hypothetical protein
VDTEDVFFGEQLKDVDSVREKKSLSLLLTGTNGIWKWRFEKWLSE